MINLKIHFLSTKLWTLLSGGSRIFERGFQFQLDKNTSSVWVEDQKKKVINFYTSLSVVFYIDYWMISNKTTVIGASQSNCSIRESWSDCSIRVYEFKKGFPWKPWNPPGSATASNMQTARVLGLRRFHYIVHKYVWSSCLI